MTPAEYAALLKLVVPVLFPDVDQSDPDEWRSGSRGSVIFSFTGEYAGKWHDFETGQTGNAFDLVKECVNGVTDFQDAKKWINRLQAGSPLRIQDGKEAQARAEKKAAAKRRALHLIVKNRQPAPSFVRDYFVERGTWPEDEPLPKTIFWLPHNTTTDDVFYHVPSADGAVMVFLQEPGKRPSAIELSYALNMLGHALDDVKSNTRWRRQHGPSKGKAFILSNQPVETTIMVEGVADALSIYKLRIPGIEIRSVCGVGSMYNESLVKGKGGLVFVPDSGIDKKIRRKIERQRMNQLTLHDRKSWVVESKKGDPDDWFQGWTAKYANERLSEIQQEYSHTDAITILLQEAADQEADRG